jgi:hypothetical protein
MESLQSPSSEFVDNLLNCLERTTVSQLTEDDQICWYAAESPEELGRIVEMPAELFALQADKWDHRFWMVGQVSLDSTFLIVQPVHRLDGVVVNIRSEPWAFQVPLNSDITVFRLIDPLRSLTHGSRHVADTLTASTITPPPSAGPSSDMTPMPANPQLVSIPAESTRLARKRKPTSGIADNPLESNSPPIHTQVISKNTVLDIDGIPRQVADHKLGATNVTRDLAGLYRLMPDDWLTMYAPLAILLVDAILRDLFNADLQALCGFTHAVHPSPNNWVRVQLLPVATEPPVLTRFLKFQVDMMNRDHMSLDHFLPRENPLHLCRDPDMTQFPMLIQAVRNLGYAEEVFRSPEAGQVWLGFATALDSTYHSLQRTVGFEIMVIAIETAQYMWTYNVYRTRAPQWSAPESCAEELHKSLETTMHGLQQLNIATNPFHPTAFYGKYGAWHRIVGNKSTPTEPRPTTHRPALPTNSTTTTQPRVCLNYVLNTLGGTNTDGTPTTCSHGSSCNYQHPAEITAEITTTLASLPWVLKHHKALLLRESPNAST